LRNYSDSKGKVIGDRQCTLQAREDALEKWLLEEVVKSCDECAGDETTGFPADQVMVRIWSQYHKVRIENLTDLTGTFPIPLRLGNFFGFALVLLQGSFKVTMFLHIAKNSGFGDFSLKST
jgi:hypothetical protein